MIEYLLGCFGLLAAMAALCGAAIIVDFDEPKGLSELLDRWR